MIQINDTLTNSKIELDTDKKIKIYLCGVTVYDDSHIGHARTIIVFDVLRRFLESKDVDVELVQNFTDVDDKIINRAQKDNVTSEQISTRYIQRYQEDFERLNVKDATRYPKATDHIKEMHDLISELIKKEIAYVTKNGVYFAVSKFSEYGKLSKKKIDDLISGARISVDEQKNDPLDFALWKNSETQPNWPSPWGNGRPGWHIECSAMSIKYLGEDFEIHGGGRDLIFPHHENEIAQSEAFTGKRFAKSWMHVGMVTIDGEKMSKSLGNIKSVRYVLDNWGANVIRLFCLSGHYSKPINYSEDLLRENITKIRQIESCYYELRFADSEKNDELIEHIVTECKNEFDDALKNDCNTPLALDAYYKLIREVNAKAAQELISESSAKKILPIFEQMNDVLGISIEKTTDDEILEINELLQKREQLRLEKDFQKADEIRDEIKKRNIILLDHKNKTVWMKHEKIKSE